jgi:hypothetical protein
MTKIEIAELFNANIAEIEQMPVAAGSMVKALLMGLDTNGPAYIRLSNARGNRVDYVLVEGQPSLVGRVGRSLGLTVTDTYVEARA